MAGLETKERILDVAEELFAAHGVGATSMRAITAGAGVNVAAAHYHFGSKQAVLEAVMKRRFDPVNQERTKRLERLRAADVEPEVEDLLYALLAPAFEALEPLGERGPLVARLVGRTLVDSSQPLRDVVRNQFKDTFAEFAGAFMEALPELPPAEVVLRLQFLPAVLHQSLSYFPEFEKISPVPVPPLDYGTALHRMVSFVAAGLRAPLSPALGGAP